MTSESKTDLHQADHDEVRATNNGTPDQEQPVEEDSGERQRFYTFDPLAPYKGLVRRFLQIQRHLIGLFAGGLIAWTQSISKYKRGSIRGLLARFTSFLIRPFVKRELRNLEFPVQLRRRLEMLGPTYIKLGQILALRRDILPRIITDELNNLLDRLPEVPFEAIEEILREQLGKNYKDHFSEINPKPLGSASIAQTHYAELKNGTQVVLKVMKPGIRDTVLTDITLLKILGFFLNTIISQYQPRRLIREFCEYTAKEVDFTNEADNADTFATNFEDMEDVIFPKIYREYCTSELICMQYFEGIKPGSDEMEELTEQQKEKLIDLGAASIIRMLYKDGFFHADLHPGNLIIIDRTKVGFIDLGMVGRFEDHTRRNMLYYFHALVTEDIPGATRYLAALSTLGPDGNMDEFQRSASDMLRRFYQHSALGDFSLGRMILESMSLGARYRVFFPVEMTLMVKALVTFEGVGSMLNPKIDIPAVSRKHVNDIFKDQFSPASLGKEFMRGLPELVDMLVRSPKIVADGLRTFDESMKQSHPRSPLEGLRSSILAGSCIVGAVIALVQGGGWYIWLSLLLIGVILAFTRK